MADFDLDLTDNLDANIELDDNTDNFQVEFGEVYYMTEKDFNKLNNRPSYNGQTMTGDTNIPLVPTKVSDLENDSDYQTGSEVESAISEAVADKQDKLTAGDNITIENNVISASDTTYTAGNGLSLSNENEFSVDTTVVATQQNLANEVTNRENADNALQAQIDGIAASSDVVDIVGTYAELQSYDTQHLKDNDIIKVLQDETQNNATTYYRWSTATDTFTLIGQEGPYYTKASADAQFVPQTRTVNSKALSSNITLTASDVSAVASSDVVQVTGNNTTKIMSQKATTDALGLKLNISDYVVDNALADSTNPVQNKVLYGILGNMPSDFFTGPVTVNGNGREITLTGTMNTKLSDVKMYGDTFQQTYSGKNVARNAYQNPVTSGDVTFTTNADGSISTSGTANTNINFYLTGSGTTYHLDAGTYTLSIGGVETSDTTCFVYIDGTGSVYWDTRNSSRLTQTVPAGGVNISPRIVVRSGFNTNGLTFKIQLESGSTATSYEPYVGGTASPNPDYPQDIQVVTGEQTVEVHGKNLFNYASASDVNNTFVSTYRLFKIEGVKANTIYTISNLGFTSSLQNTYVYLWNSTSYSTSNKIMLADPSAYKQSASLATNSDSELYLAIYPTDTTTWTNVISYFDNAQVELGSATTYEPYQGASYDVHLGNMFDVNTVEAGDIKKGNATIRLCSIQNLWLDAGTYTFSSNIQSPFQYILGINQVGAPPLSDYPTYSYDSGWTSAAQTTFTLTQAGWLSVQFRKNDNTTLTVNDIKSYSFYLNRGSSIVAPIELCKIGNYQDYIYKSGDDWYVHKETGKVTLDGTESWQYTSGEHSRFVINKSDIALGGGVGSTPVVKSDYFMPTDVSSMYAGLNNSIASHNSAHQIWIRDNSITSDTDFKTWLSTHNTTVYYALATPTDTKITDSTLIGELEALRDAYCYDGTTILETSANELSAILDVTAFKKTLAGLIGAINRS